MSTVMSFRAHGPAAAPAGAAAGDQANSGHDGPYPRQNNLRFTGFGQPAGKDWSVVTLESFHATLHPGLRRPQSVAEGTTTLRFVARVPGRLVLWSFSAIEAGMRNIRRSRMERGIAASLERLDDATLKHIGVCRSEILHVARTQTSVEWWA
jgi:hypothetical protein